MSQVNTQTPQAPNPFEPTEASRAGNKMWADAHRRSRGQTLRQGAKREAQHRGEQLARFESELRTATTDTQHAILEDHIDKLFTEARAEADRNPGGARGRRCERRGAVSGRQAGEQDAPSDRRSRKAPGRPWNMTFGYVKDWRRWPSTISGPRSTSTLTSGEPKSRSGSAVSTSSGRRPSSSLPRCIVNAIQRRRRRRCGGRRARAQHPGHGQGGRAARRRLTAGQRRPPAQPRLRPRFTPGPPCVRICLAHERQ